MFCKFCDISTIYTPIYIYIYLPLPINLFVLLLIWPTIFSFLLNLHSIYYNKIQNEFHHSVIKFLSSTCKIPSSKKRKWRQKNSILTNETKWQKLRIPFVWKCLRFICQFKSINGINSNNKTTITAIVKLKSSQRKKVERKKIKEQKEEGSV